MSAPHDFAELLIGEQDQILANFRQRLRLWYGRPLLEMRIEITPQQPPAATPPRPAGSAPPPDVPVASVAQSTLPPFGQYTLLPLAICPHLQHTRCST